MSELEQKPKRKMVSLSQDTLDELAKKRQGFESPNDCIQRLMKTYPCSETTSDQDEEEI